LIVDGCEEALGNGGQICADAIHRQADSNLRFYKFDFR
jgi:hypothetical protein